MSFCDRRRTSTRAITLESVGAWTLQEFCQYVYKTNVYSGVILGERKNSRDKAANRTARERKAELRAYMRKPLLTLKAEGYPLPLPKIGPAKLKQ